jgi:serine/threonine protein kinase
LGANERIILSQAFPPNSTISHYRIVSQIGAGGMGEVYLAEDSRLHRKVALKILPAEMAANQDRMRRFKQEATAAAALNHPNIAHIYEIGESEGTNYRHGVCRRRYAPPEDSSRANRINLSDTGLGIISIER